MTRNGVFPLTYFAPLVYPPPARARAVSPELAESVKSISPEPSDTEKRHVVQMQCSLRRDPEGSGLAGSGGEEEEEEEAEGCMLKMTLLLRMDDKMNRQLTCDISSSDSGPTLADELVRYGFINAVSASSLHERRRLKDLLPFQSLVTISSALFQVDRDVIANLIDDALRLRSVSNSPPHLIEQRA